MDSSGQLNSLFIIRGFLFIYGDTSGRSGRHRLHADLDCRYMISSSYEDGTLTTIRWLPLSPLLAFFYLATHLRSSVHETFGETCSTSWACSRILEHETGLWFGLVSGVLPRGLQRTYSLRWARTQCDIELVRRGECERDTRTANLVTWEDHCDLCWWWVDLRQEGGGFTLRT
jgi:hypothetical protein